MNKELLLKKYKKAEKLAKQLGFDVVRIYEHPNELNFVARHRPSGIDLTAEFNGKKYIIEIGGTMWNHIVPKNMAKLRNRIKIMQNAIKVQEVLM